MKISWKKFFMQVANLLVEGKYKAYFTLGTIIFLYVFRSGFWGMDFLAVGYTLFICLPFFILFYQVSFTRYYCVILIVMGVVWAMGTHTYPVFWVILLSALYCFDFYGLYFCRLNHKESVQLTKMIVLLLLFAGIYEPLKATWYIETIIWVRLYSLFAFVVLIYAGSMMLMHDLKVHRLKKRMKQYDEKSTMRRHAI